MLSWCALQRPDTDGVLDAANDILLDLPTVTTPNLWCKMTISSFSLGEMIAHYADDGWDVRPVLIVRDVRAIFNSLMGKTYGSNGTTAEDPPLRMRLRRFLRDWEHGRERWPIVRYESLVVDPPGTLRAMCDRLGLSWHDDMIRWPKKRADIADARHGSPTFRSSLGEGFSQTVDPSLAQVKVDRVPADDLRWLEETFAEFNRAMDYEPQLSPGPEPGRAQPRYEATRRHRRQQKPIARLQTRISSLRKKLFRK